jgi:hypothetical protein
VRNLAGAVHEIGKLYLEQGRLTEARAHLRQALPRLCEVGNREYEAELLIMPSRAYRMLGDCWAIQTRRWPAANAA